MTTMPNLAGRRILLVEDEYFIAADMSRAFEGGGAEVLGPVGQVAEALALIARTERIDGAVLDVNLHDTQIFPVADALRGRHVPFVFATGYERSSIPARYADVPCHEKPVEPAAVAASLFR